MLKHSDIEMISLNEISFFSSLKSKTLKMFLVLITAMLVVGCIEVKHDIQLNNDESGEISIELLIKPDYVSIALPEIDKRIKNHPSKDWQVSHNGKVDGKEQVIITKSFQNISELSDNHTSFALNVTPTDDGKKRYSLAIKQLASSEGRSPFEYLVKMPGELTESNGKNMTTNEVLWRFKGVRRGQKMTASAIGSAGFSFGFSGITSGLDNIFNAIFLNDGNEYEALDCSSTIGCAFFPLDNEEALITEIDHIDVDTGEEALASSYHLKNGVKTDLGNLGGAFTSLSKVSKDGSVAIGIGTTENGNTHSFVWKNGKITDLGTLGGKNTKVLRISDNGLAAIGMSDLANGKSRLFHWKDGKMSEVPAKSDIEKFYGVTLSASGEMLSFSGDASKVENLWNSKNNNLVSFEQFNQKKLGGKDIRINLISHDGNFVVGTALDKRGRKHLYYWHQGNANLHDLGYLNSGSAIDMSQDSSVIVGNKYYLQKDYTFKTKAFIYTGDNGIINLDVSNANSLVMSVSNDGVWATGTINAKPVFWKNKELIGIKNQLGGVRYFGTNSPSKGAISGLYEKENGDIYYYRAKNGVVNERWKIVNSNKSSDIFYAKEFLQSKDGTSIAFLSGPEGSVSKIGGYKPGALKQHAFTRVKIAGLPIITARSTFYGIISLISAILFGLLSFKLYKWLQTRPRLALASSNQAIFCTSCGKPQKAGIVFCTSCGAKQET